MGKISTRLATRLRGFRNRRVAYPGTFAKVVQQTRDLQDSVRDIKELVNEGLDPLHAAYASTQNLLSLFAETVSELPEFREYYDVVGSAEDEYLPEGPPTSPLTGSYFTAWAFFDLQFGEDKEAIGSCLLDVSKYLHLSAEMIEMVILMQNSRMGIYEHCGINNSQVVLREFVSEEEFCCDVPAGYLGEKGQLWFVRILPQLKYLCEYNVICTTPYVLMNDAKVDWLAFINRTLPKMKIFNREDALHNLMKYGPEPNYWHEYIFQAYHHHQYDAIFLAGFPDIKESRPHAY